MEPERTRVSHMSADLAVQEALLALIPASKHEALKDFNASPEEFRTRNRLASVSLNKSLAKRKTFHYADACIDWATHIFQSINEGHTWPESVVAVALLLVTGRRTYEILSGLSTFEQYGSNGYHVLFRGQAKRSSWTNADAYCFQALQLKCGSRRTRDDVSTEVRRREPRPPRCRPGTGSHGAASQVSDATCARSPRCVCAHRVHHVWALGRGAPDIRHAHAGSRQGLRVTALPRLRVAGLDRRLPSYRIDIDYSTPQCADSESEEDNAEPPSA